jgi:energy-coupling factor transporter transmembrane protein EcfT
VSEHDEHDDEWPDDRPGRAPHRDDGWRGLLREETGPPRIRAGKDLFLHCLESAGLVFVASLVIAGAMPRSVNWQLITITFACLTAVTFYTAMRTTRSTFMSVYLLTWGVLLTVWFTAERHFGLPHELIIAGLFIPSLILAGIGPVAIGHHRQALAAEDTAASGRANELEVKRWVRLFANHGAPGVTVIDVREENGVIEVRGRLGRATRDRRALTYRQLEMIAPEIAVSLQRDPDGVYFSRPEHGSAADFTLHIRPKRRGARPTVHMPLENKPLTVNRALEFGIFDNGKPFRQSLREAHVLIGGSTGWGKSSLLNVFIALLAACNDALIWMIDMSGGMTARPWIMPYLAEHANRPVIDWIATERAEAKLMLETALEVGRIRSTYPVFEKITPSEATPALILICDDMGACFGHGKVTGSTKAGDRVSNWGLSQLGSEFTELARKAAGSMVGAVQRTNVELMGNTGIKAMSDIRFGLHCNDSVDGGRIFPDDPASARLLSELQDRGDALVKRPGGITPVVHLYRIEPEERITDRALYCGDLRPQLEPQCAGHLGDAYAERWDRCTDLLDAWREAGGIPQPPDPDDEFGSIVAFNKLEGLADPPGGIDPREKRMLQIIREAGWTGLYVRQIMSRLQSEGKNPPARETVQRWLAKNADKGKLHRPARGSGWRWANLGDDDDMPDVM